MPDMTPFTLGAFRGCDAHEREHGINYAAVMEWTGPAAVDRILRAAEDEGIWCALRDDDDYDHQHCYATLDVRSEDGDILDDLCIPTGEAFAWWTRAVELRADMADCPVDEPEVHAATYARAEAGR
ncbi:MAG TPA: hypothetical protein VIQ30_25535 [Pseudonocardia sp.]